MWHAVGHRSGKYLKKTLQSSIFPHPNPLSFSLNPLLFFFLLRLNPCLLCSGQAHGKGRRQPWGRRPWGAMVAGTRGKREMGQRGIDSPPHHELGRHEEAAPRRRAEVAGGSSGGGARGSGRGLRGGGRVRGGGGLPRCLLAAAPRASSRVGAPATSSRRRRHSSSRRFLTAVRLSSTPR